MKIRWSKPIPISRLLGPGGKCGELIPELAGIYRLKTLTGKGNVSKGSVIYIGKVGGGSRKDRHLRRRIGEFIISGMGFGIPHSGGIRFWDDGDEHEFWVQDLAVEYFPTNDPTCAEITAFEDFSRATAKSKPLWNKNIPRQPCREHGL